MTEARSYPDRPVLAVSAAILRDGHVLIVRRARPPAQGLYTLPGGAVEAGETLMEALVREVREELGMAIQPIALAGYREAIMRDDDKRVARHYVILPFAARWVAGEPALGNEIAEARWLRPSEITSLTTTEGLGEIVAAAFEQLEQSG
jgi:8-oxo-dGTP diphosphatase